MEERKAGFKGKIPQEIYEALADNRCILFVGAGLSQGVIRSDNRSLPNWKGLLSEMACWLEARCSDLHKKTVIEDIKKTIAKDKLVQAGQALQNEMKKSEMAEFLDSVFRDEAVRPSKVHLLIPQIPLKAILTTNYDKLIEMAFHKRDQDISVFTHAEISSHFKKDRFIFKVHGDIDRPDSIILGNKGLNMKKMMSTLKLQNS